jgi:hypothetical protein
MALKALLDERVEIFARQNQPSNFELIESEVHAIK